MLFLLLFVTGLIAGTIDAIAGGGGLISVPILFATGMPPHVVLGTNKLQSSVGTAIAAWKYYRHGLISLKNALPGLLFGLAGATLGAIVSQTISGDFLRTLIPILLTAILIYTLISPKLGNDDRRAKISPSLFYATIGFSLAFYDGFFGPGVGSFWVFLLTFFLGYNLIKATAYTKLFNLNSNIIALLCFMLGGNVDYRIGLCMALGQLLGGRLGAHLAITKGAALIRPFFLSIVTLTIMTLLLKTFSSSPLSASLTNHYGRMPFAMIFMLTLSFVLFIYYKRVKKI